MTSPEPDPTDGQQTWTIADLADEFGVTHRTLRYYEQIGLLSPVREGPKRLFGPRDRVRLELVLRGKRLGFALEEIAKIVDMYDKTPGERGQLEYLISQVGERRADLRAKRADIEAALAELDELEARCTSELSRLQRDRVDQVQDQTRHPATVRER